MGESIFLVVRVNPMVGFEWQGRDLELDFVFNLEAVQRAEHWSDVVTEVSAAKHMHWCIFYQLQPAFLFAELNNNNEKCLSEENIY